MVLFNKKAECYGCGMCAAVCAADAIVMQEDDEGFRYPFVSAGKCTECGRCLDACSKMHQIEQRDGAYYAVRCKEEELLRKSTSGGAFSLIAEEFLKEGGLVCGACMDENCHVIHRMSGQMDGMRKSKYVESDIHSLYSEMGEALKKGRKLLFSGTPCQCQAIRSYFHACQEQVRFVSVLCRGVQSKRLWEEYLAYLGKDTAVTFYDFRDKSRCDDAHMVKYRLGEETYVVPRNKDPFSRLYAKCLTLRPSCYTCEFCRPDVPFDFTIGDFWGIEKISAELADGKGTSLVITRSPWAEKIMERVQERAQVSVCRKEDCMQPALQSPAKESMLRKFLFKDLKTVDADGHCNMELILKKYGV